MCIVYVGPDIVNIALGCKGGHMSSFTYSNHLVISLNTNFSFTDTFIRKNLKSTMPRGDQAIVPCLGIVKIFKD